MSEQGHEIIYDCYGADLAGVSGGYFEEMRRLGILWSAHEAQSMADQIRFFGCTNIPDDLPDYVEVCDGNSAAKRTERV